MAITIRKDRNMVYIQSTNNTRSYSIDTNCGALIGLRGSALCSIPTALRDERWELNGDLFANYIYRYVTNGCFRSASRYRDTLSLYEKLSALNCPYLQYSSLSSRQAKQIEDNWSVVCKAIHALTETTYLNELVDKMVYLAWKEKNCVQTDEHFTENMAREIFNQSNEWTKEQIHRAGYYLAKGLAEYHGSYYQAIDKIASYFNYCEKLGEQPSKGDFMRLYVEAKRKYNLRKAEYDDRTIAEYQNSVADKLAFENDNFVVIIPTTSQELRDESEMQNNCVGRIYLPRVIDKQTHIVFVRRKDNPNASYITCEVSNYGDICQYLLSYNRYVAADSIEEEFYKSYRAHLAEVW